MNQILEIALSFYCKGGLDKNLRQQQKKGYGHLHWKERNETFGIRKQML